MRNADDYRTFRLLKAQALRGDAELMWLVGTAYRDGHFHCIGQESDVPVRRNLRLALHWLERAAEKRNTGGMVDLAALLYQQGLNAKDAETRRSKFSEALRWELRAWRHGEFLAAWNAAITCSALGRRKACFKWLCNSYRKSGEDLEAVALCYATGYGVRKDAAKARTLLRKVKRQCNATTGDSKVASNLLAKLRRGERIEIKEPITQMIMDLETENVKSAK